MEIPANRRAGVRSRKRSRIRSHDLASLSLRLLSLVLYPRFGSLSQTESCGATVLVPLFMARKGYFSTVRMPQGLIDIRTR
jgi:hypothetical protein